MSGAPSPPFIVPSSAFAFDDKASVTSIPWGSHVSSSLQEVLFGGFRPILGSRTERGRGAIGYFSTIKARARHSVDLYNLECRSADETL